MTLEEAYNSIYQKEKGIPVEIGDLNTSVVLSPVSKKSGHILTNVKTDVFDKAYQQTDDQYQEGWGFYVGRGGKGSIHGRYERFKEFVKQNIPIEASEVSIRSDGTVHFTNGRHRYAVMRDSGLSEIPIALDKISLRNAQKYNIV